MKQTRGVLGRVMSFLLVSFARPALPDLRGFGMPASINFSKEDGPRP
jgi:hypothetical protein